MAGGGFAKGGESKAAMGFYGTNVGYDRTFSFGDDSLIIGAMAEFGGSKRPRPKLLMTSPKGGESWTLWGSTKGGN